MLVIKGVNVYPSEIETTLLGVDDLLPQYQLIVDRRSTLARLEVQVEPAQALVERTAGLQPGHPALAAVRREVAARLRQSLGLGVEVTVVRPRTIPRSEGKAVRVIELT
jgi:phenylacetate-CoA ligase